MNTIVNSGKWPGLNTETIFKTLIEEAPTPVGLYLGRELRVSLVNKFILKVWGKDESVIGKTFREALPELEGQPFFQILDDVYTSGEVYSSKASRVDLEVDGRLQTFYFDITYTPLKHNGSVWGILNTAADVTELVIAQKALAESEKLFRTVTTASPTALWMTDATGNIIYASQTWVHWTGAPVEAQYGIGWINAVAEEDRQQAVEKFIKDFSAHHFHENIFRIKHFAGRVRWVVCTGNPQFESDGTFTGYIGACVDITEQKQLQQQKDEFLGIASHELRTPVTSIKAYAQVMMAMFKKEGDEKKVSMLQKMDSQLNRLTSLIGDLLDVTKINSGKLQFNNTTFAFDDMVDEVVNDLQHTTTKHVIEKQFKGSGIITADRDRLIQVLTNLITNAIKYSPHSKTIVVHTKRNGNEAEVCVQDFGIGISPEKQGHVFEQFYRVSGDMQHTFPGLGLGLYISSEIIKREGGRIWVNSEEGKGSIFCFAVPDKPLLNN